MFSRECNPLNPKFDPGGLLSFDMSEATDFRRVGVAEAMRFFLDIDLFYSRRTRREHGRNTQRRWRRKCKRSRCRRIAPCRVASYVYFVLFYIQDEEVSPFDRLVGRSLLPENEIERSLRARIASLGLDGRDSPKCLSQSSFVFVATDTARPCPYIVPFHPRNRPVHRAHSSFLSLLISPFCLLVFLSRFATRLARASAPFLLSFGERARNCPALYRPAARGDGGHPGAADGVPVRMNVEGRGPWRRPRTYTTCPEACTLRKQETNKSGARD